MRGWQVTAGGTGEVSQPHGVGHFFESMPAPRLASGPGRQLVITTDDVKFDLFVGHSASLLGALSRSN